MDATVAALLGTAIGATLGVLGTVGSTWFQQHHQTRREFAKIAVDLATSEYAYRVSHAREGAPIPPMSVFVAYHMEMLQEIADGKFGPDTIRTMNERQRRLFEAILEGEKRFRPES